MGEATLGKHFERNEKEGEEEGKGGRERRQRRQRRKRGSWKEKKGEGEEKVKRRAGQYAQAGYKSSEKRRKDANKCQCRRRESIKPGEVDQGARQRGTICPDWPRGSDRSDYSGEMKKFMVGEDDLGEARTR